MSTQYNTFAPDCGKLEQLPGEILAANALRRILRSINLAGLRVLDLGGGTGTYARMAMHELGAASVVSIDISNEMVKIGEDLETRREGEANITYQVADCSKSLAHLNLPLASFDVVMANWVLCYAETVADLQGMWQNIATCLKPDGQFVGLINLKPSAASMRPPGPYGIESRVVDDNHTSSSADDNDVVVQKIHTIAHTRPSTVEFDAFLLPEQAHFDVPADLGMEKVRNEKVEWQDAVGIEIKEPDADRNYWQLFFQDPYFSVLRAEKS